MLQRWGIMLQKWGIILQVVDTNAGGRALCCRGGALCFKWWIQTREVGHYASSGGGIKLQVVDANAGGGALCCRGGALCCKWGVHEIPPVRIMWLRGSLV